MTAFGYARVSTDGQTLAAQDCSRPLAAPRSIARQPAERRLTGQHCARPLPAFAIVMTRLNRLARSTRDLVNTLDEVAKHGAGFKSLADTWADTTTPHGRLMLTVLGGLAEFERELIRARTNERSS
jgi:DNA invertase Pin-like site-specific DNA recombinase